MKVAVVPFFQNESLIRAHISGDLAHLVENVPMIEKAAYDKEREINKVLREALEDCMDTIKRQWGNAHPEFVTAYDAIAREKEMRNGDLRS